MLPRRVPHINMGPAALTDYARAARRTVERVRRLRDATDRFFVDSDFRACAERMGVDPRSRGWMKALEGAFALKAEYDRDDVAVVREAFEQGRRRVARGDLDPLRGLRPYEDPDRLVKKLLEGGDPAASFEWAEETWRT